MSNSSISNRPYDYKSNSRHSYQQKNYSNRYQERDCRDRLLSQKEAHSKRDTDRHGGSSREQQIDSPRIKIQSKPRIVIGGGVPKSQILDHFVFNRIKVAPLYEQQLIQQLKKYFDSEYGSVSHLTKSSDSQPGSLVIKLGFQTDSSALKALKGDIDQIKITIDREHVKISGKPTGIFEAWLKYRDDKKTSKRRDSSSSQQSSDRERSRNKRTQHRNRKDSRRRRRHYSSSSSSSSSSQRSNSRQKNQKYYAKSIHSRRQEVSNDRSGSFNNYKKDNKTQQSFSKQTHNNSKDRSLQPDLLTLAQVDSVTRGNQNPKIYKNLLFWGIPVMTSAKRVDEFLQKHRDGRFISKRELVWKKLEGSEVCKVLSGQFEQRMAQKLLRTEVPMEVDGDRFIAVQADFQDKKRYIEKLSQYQVNIKLPVEVEPYYLMKWLSSCGKVIQVVSNNKFTDSGLSDSYNVTFASKLVCRQLKAIKKTSKGTQIYEITSADDFVPIYRQTPKTQKQPEIESQFQEISQRFSVSPSRN